MQKEITCIDDFSYPTLTEGKVYEMLQAEYPDEVLIIDDAWHERWFPIKQFDRDVIKRILGYE